MAPKRTRATFTVEYRKPSDTEWHWWTTVMYRALAEKIVRRMEGRYAMRIVKGTETV